MSSQTVLLKQFKELTTNPVPGFTISLVDDNIFEWQIGIIGPPDTIYQSGYFLTTMKFPDDYPFRPPSFVFINEFYHPNVYPDGRLCISILHSPGDDPISGEKAEERWNPTQTVESILLSIISLLNDPNTSSPANVDAGVLYRNDRNAYNQIVLDLVEKSKKDIPADLVIPTSLDQYQAKTNQDVISPHDEAFWCEDDQDGFPTTSEDDHDGFPTTSEDELD